MSVRRNYSVEFKVEAAHRVIDSGRSAAPIDRYLAPTRRKMSCGVFPQTTAGPLLDNSITVRKAGDEVERVQGVKGSAVAHCGPALTGETARILNHTHMLNITSLQLTWTRSTKRGDFRRLGRLATGAVSGERSSISHMITCTDPLGIVV